MSLYPIIVCQLNTYCTTKRRSQNLFYKTSEIHKLSYIFNPLLLASFLFVLFLLGQLLRHHDLKHCLLLSLFFFFSSSPSPFLPTPVTSSKNLRKAYGSELLPICVSKNQFPIFPNPSSIFLTAKSSVLFS